MDLTTIFRKTTTPQSQITSVEAFNIWNSLRVRYLSIEKNQLLGNFAHDASLKNLMDVDLKLYNNQAEALETMLRTYRIKAPHKPPAKIKFTKDIDAITDQMIYTFTLDDIATELFNLKRSLVSSSASENLRGAFIKFTNEHTDVYVQFHLFGKSKGWTEVAPAFKTKPVKKEPLSVSEANHIWDHLNLRYDQLQLTNFIDFVHDPDFGLILLTGKKLLEKQIKILEDLAVKQEIPLPKRPPAVMESTTDPEIMEDRFAFRIILDGIQNAVDLHIRAVVETVRNDKLRAVFLELLKKEYGTLNNLFKYGAIKGWMHIAPTYRIQ